MSTSLYFLEAPDEQSHVLNWFRALPVPPEETLIDYGVVLYFQSFGPVVYDDTGSIDVTRSPIVTLVKPTVRRGILWTVGEVHFRSTLHLDQNKAIQKVARHFSKWLKGYAQVYDQSAGAKNEFAYYLEGSSQNWGAIFALPSGFEHLSRCEYYVSYRDNEFVLDRVCRTLKLRGVECS